MSMFDQGMRGCISPVGFAVGLGIGIDGEGDVECRDRDEQKFARIG
jgi:hypothetical protein